MNAVSFGVAFGRRRRDLSPAGLLQKRHGGVLRSRGDSQQLFYAVCQDLFHLRRDP